MADSVFELSGFEPAEDVTSSPVLNKILGIILGSVGTIGVAAIAVAAIMSPKTGKIVNRFTAGTVKKVYSGANIVWQILETFLRSRKISDPVKEEKLNKYMIVVDQVFDLAGILINNEGLKALIGKEDRSGPY